MQIRREQFDEFHAQALNRANARMVKYLKARFPDVCTRVTNEELLKFVQAQRLRAKQYGVEREDNFAVFLDLLAMYGVDFPEQPWALDVMASNLHGPDKIAVLRNRVEDTGVVISNGG